MPQPTRTVTWWRRTGGTAAPAPTTISTSTNYHQILDTATDGYLYLDSPVGGAVDANHDLIIASSTWVFEMDMLVAGNPKSEYYWDTILWDNSGSLAGNLRGAANWFEGYGSFGSTSIYNITEATTMRIVGHGDGTATYYAIDSGGTTNLGTLSGYGTDGLDYVQISSMAVSGIGGTGMARFDNLSAVPEPATLGLAMLVLGSLALRRRRF